MRAQILRGTSFRLLAVLLGSTAVVQAWADDLARNPPAVTTAAPLAMAGQAIVLPELPQVDVMSDHDVTGSIAGPSKASAAPDAAAPAPGVEGAVPAALPFDDQVLPSGAAPGSVPASATAGQSASTLPNSGALPVPAPTAADPLTPPPPLDAPSGALASPPSATAAQQASPQGLDAPALTEALATFADEKLPGPETTAQANERHKVRADIAAFYAARAYAPLWITDGHLTEAARSVLARLDHAAEDGLDLRRFAVPMPRNQETAVLAKAELALSEAAVAYARQASGSRVDIAKLGGIIDLRPDVADAARVLASLPGAADAGEALRAFNPPQSGYEALRQKLAELRQRSTPEAQTRIPPGPVLKTGMTDARVPLVRARFGLDVVAGEAGASSLVYDTKVAAAVAEFQRSKRLPASGELTPGTIAALTGGNPSRLENLIVANMEEWRWLPRDLGPDRVEVNIPEYKVRVIRDGVVTHEAKVVVGQPDKPTPVFSQQMRFIIVNPYWNVPLSIIRKEMMPKLAAEPDYFQTHGYEVIERNGITYVRQPPGDGNALGRIKFMFPNEHAVYLHDTNVRSVFGREKRALSHGCVRVDDPFSFAEAVLGRQNGWSEARIKRLIGGHERTIMLPHPLPIYLVYFTAFVDAKQGFQVRDDVYGYTNRVRLALGLQS